MISAWVGLQLFILKKQQSKPRFLIPRFLRHRIFSHIYMYKRYFNEEIDNLSSAQLYQSMETQDEERFIREQKLYSTDHNYILKTKDETDEQRAARKKHNKVQRLRDNECVICL